jgi:hypothetical protein
MIAAIKHTPISEDEEVRTICTTTQHRRNYDLVPISSAFDKFKIIFWGRNALAIPQIDHP